MARKAPASLSKAPKSKTSKRANTTDQKNATNSLTVPTATTSYRPLTADHFAELSALWNATHTFPNAKSRKEWSKARDVNPNNVYAWWSRRKKKMEKEKENLQDVEMLKHELPNEEDGLRELATALQHSTPGLHLEPKEEIFDIPTHSLSLAAGMNYQFPKPLTDSCRNSSPASLPSSSILTTPSPPEKCAYIRKPQSSLDPVLLLPSLPTRCPLISKSLKNKKNRAYMFKNHHTAALRSSSPPLPHADADSYYFPPLPLPSSNSSGFASISEFLHDSFPVLPGTYSLTQADLISTEASHSKTSLPHESCSLDDLPLPPSSPPHFPSSSPCSTNATICSDEVKADVLSPSLLKSSKPAESEPVRPPSSQPRMPSPFLPPLTLSPSYVAPNYTQDLDADLVPPIWQLPVHYERSVTPPIYCDSAPSSLSNSKTEVMFICDLCKAQDLNKLDEPEPELSKPVAEDTNADPLRLSNPLPIHLMNFGNISFELPLRPFNFRPDEDEEMLKGPLCGYPRNLRIIQ